MRILIALFDIEDLGGIIEHTEHLMWGFKEIGVECDLMQMCWSEKISDQRRVDISRIQYGASGIPYDQKRGWIFPKEKRIPYKGKENIKKWKKIADKYDLIIWTIPVPSSGKKSKDDEDWIELYNTSTPQVAIIHDGNFERTYKKLQYVINDIDILVGVHPCAYNSIGIDKQKKLILNPQANIKNRTYRDKFNKKIPGWLSLQTFKAWKRVEDVVGSVRYQKNKWLKLVAGGGIEYHYMTSKNKVKDQYLHKDGKRIWEEAENNGMKYLNYLQSDKRDKLLRLTRFLIDCSWSKKYSQHGEHFNRVTVEAMISGAVPICRRWSDKPEIILPGINYVELPPVGSSFKEIAQCIDGAVGMGKKEYEEYRDNNYELINKFDAIKIAKKYINLVS